MFKEQVVLSLEMGIEFDNVSFELLIANCSTIELQWPPYESPKCIKENPRGISLELFNIFINDLSEKCKPLNTGKSHAISPKNKVMEYSFVMKSVRQFRHKTKMHDHLS